MGMRQNIRERHSPNGRWLPPKQLGHNVKYAHPRNPTPVFYHDGHGTRVRNLPRNARVYKTFSIYYDQAVFWTVDYDATRRPVDNGLDFDSARGGTPHDEDSSSNEEDETGDDWRPLSFGPAPDDNTYLSYAGRRLQWRTLRVQRPDQVWAYQLLPDTYQAPPANWTRNRNVGGLVGELPLLIGLAAMSLPQQGQWNMYNALPHMIVNPRNDQRGSWRVFPPQHVPRRSGWSDKRGLVVTVYYNPDETDEEDLEAYEEGRGGPILA